MIVCIDHIRGFTLYFILAANTKKIKLSQYCIHHDGLAHMYIISETRVCETHSDCPDALSILWALGFVLAK